MNILAIVPARSGSKSVPHKNIRHCAGKPMLAYSIEHARQSKYINRVILSTDSTAYAEIGREYGAEAPFLRPQEYAQDQSLDIEAFYHCLNYLKEKEGYHADIVVHLRPTYPIRDIQDIDNMIELLLKHNEADSVRSIAPAKEIPYKMWYKDGQGYLTPVIWGITSTPDKQEITECYNRPRQELPQVYYQNACIDVVRGRVIQEERSMSGRVILGYEMAKNYDIDTEDEFLRAEERIRITSGQKRFVFDIDGVIAKLQGENDYGRSEPNHEMIKVVNALYDCGNYIVLHTARGYVTGIDWKDITVMQLREWGLKYHELHFGKPNADYYIDDKMLDMNILKEIFL
jgi:CMP-N,N'-diacetyllegionaminic acid synthase